MNLKKLYEKKVEAIKLALSIGSDLDREIEDRWGFHYSETDDDSIIDTLDYATDSLSYEDFVRKMDQYKRNLTETGKSGVVF